MKLPIFCCSFFSALLTFSAQAEPWIDTSDLYLKADIQQLANAGFITTPITTYPLMWNDIERDLKKIDVDGLTSPQTNAYYYIKHQLKLAKQNLTRFKANIASSDSRFTSFGDTYREKNSLQIQSTFLNKNFAAKIAPTYTTSNRYGQSNRFDDSYLAAFWGNWVVSIGKQERWFGPTWDTSFSLTNNARPMLAIALSRKSALPVTIPYTQYTVPWTLTTFMGKMDDERIVNNTLLWGFRLNFKPLKNLEIGLSRLAQWGGDNRSTSISTFWDILIGRTNCGIDDLICNENNPNPANQQAGYDFRYSTSLFNTPITIYGQKFAEDGSAEAFRYVTKAQLQLGIDANITLLDIPSTLYFEYGDSLADCGVRDNIGDCYYEHSSYLTGMRYHGRTISNLYDNDTKSYVLGVISQLGTNTHVTHKLRYLELNYDNRDKAPNNPLIGNPLTSIAENMTMLSSSIRHSYKNWRFTLDLKLSHSTFKNSISSTSSFDTALTVEYNL